MLTSRLLRGDGENLTSHHRDSNSDLQTSPLLIDYTTVLALLSLLSPLFVTLLRMFATLIVDDILSSHKSTRTSVS